MVGRQGASFRFPSRSSSWFSDARIRGSAWCPEHSKDDAAAHYSWFDFRRTLGWHQLRYILGNLRHVWKIDYRVASKLFQNKGTSFMIELARTWDGHGVLWLMWLQSRTYSWTMTVAGNITDNLLYSRVFNTWRACLGITAPTVGPSWAFSIE